MCNLQKQLYSLLEKSHWKDIKVQRMKCIQRFYKNHPEIICESGEVFIKILFSFALIAYATHIYCNGLYTEECAFIMPQQLLLAFRPPENCNFCNKIENIERLKSITSTTFTEKYAYSAIPIIVEDGTYNWTALQIFNYWYFRNVYNNAKYKKKVLDCQFLPYDTGFRDIFDALDMPQERVEFHNEPNAINNQTHRPWYFGWSNCNSETAEGFRKHYTRPYFLSDTSENNAIEWFFIGTTGLGAQMHIDNVGLPSWQAQLAGSKLWLLAPPPECYFQCKAFNVVVRNGEIIVIDTNKWYHQTSVLSGEISLSIGAEYD